MMLKKNLYIIFIIILFNNIANAQLDAPNLINTFVPNPCTMSLPFSPVSGAEKYHVQISTSSDFDSEIINDTTYITNYYLPILKYSTLYFVRIRAINSTDTSLWSNTVSNTTASRGTVSVQQTTNGNHIAIETRNTCALECWWEVDTTQTFDSPILRRDTTYSDHNITIETPYYFCTNYYIRNKARTVVDTTPNWSHHQWNYINIPCSPTLVSPNNFNFTNSISNLKIERYNQPLRYVFELDTTLAFTNPREFEIAETDNSDIVSVGDFYFEKQHYWRARAINSIDTSDWSSVFTFSMCGVHQISPLNQATNISTNASISVLSIGNIIGYIFELDTVPDFSSNLYMQYETPNSAVNLQNLLFGTTYYWRVRAYHSLDTSNYTPVRSFTTVTAPALISPEDLSANQNLIINLKAKFLSGITKYQYQLSQNPEFLPEQTETLEHSNYANMVQTDLLKFNTKYYWKARYINENDTSIWSSVFSFETLIKPQLIEPSNQATQVTINNTKLYWQNIQHINSYTIWISTTPDYNEYEEYLQIFYGNIMYLNNLLPNTTYYWKVKATSATDESEWSETWSFTTENTTKADLFNIDYKLQIFPNPSNNDFYVKITLPNYQNAEIKIAGLNGHLQSIIPITNETTTIPTKGWKPGVYICNLFVDGELVKVEKLVYE
ncbi:MAG TPA: T9SS type A sorting domain-containing protein [Bacteroidales bacterium]|nr:T9SS type A sorting domain-containing protein [Bacteroidales bacterium]